MSSVTEASTSPLGKQVEMPVFFAFWRHQTGSFRSNQRCAPQKVRLHVKSEHASDRTAPPIVASDP